MIYLVIFTGEIKLWSNPIGKTMNDEIVWFSSVSLNTNIKALPIKSQEMWLQSWTSNFQIDINVRSLHDNAIGSHWWLAEINSSNGFVTLENTKFLESVSSHLLPYGITWTHWVKPLICHVKQNVWTQNAFIYTWIFSTWFWFIVPLAALQNTVVVF